MSVPSITAADCRQHRPARLAMAGSISRSRNKATPGDSASASCLRMTRRAFRNNAGSSRMRLRFSGDVSRQAAYSSPASRLLSLCEAMAVAIRWQCSTLARATGTRYFMAT